MSKHYSQTINEAISRRIDEVEMKMLRNNLRFRELNRRKNAFLKLIAQNLPPDQQNLILGLDDCYIEREALAHEVLYRQGVKDGFNFGGSLRKYGK